MIKNLKMSTLENKMLKFKDHFREILRKDENLTEDEVNNCYVRSFPRKNENGVFDMSKYGYYLPKKINEKISERTKQRLENLWNNS